MSLIAYLQSNSIKCKSEDADADVIFFGVRKAPEAMADALKSAMAAHKGVFGEVDPLDGKEHNYIELGVWIGDQESALLLIGLGAALGLWKLLTPRTVLGNLCSPEMAAYMAGMGMVSMQVTLTAKTDALD